LIQVFSYQLSVKEIKAPIAEEMKTFEQKFKDSLKSKTPLLDKITQIGRAHV